VTSWYRFAVAATVACCVAGSAESARAQAELFGTYVRYLSIASDGTMACEECGRRSMQYGDETAELPSCDLYFPGRPNEGFTLEGTVGGMTVRASNTSVMFMPDDVVALDAPEVAGRSIVWRGNAMLGSSSVSVEQTHSFELDEKFVRTTLRITNTGPTAIADLYYLRNGDPDHGICNIGDEYATQNDVRRQPPTDRSALTTARAGDGGGPGRVVVLGIGAHDGRARVYNGGFSNIDASGEWTMPRDGRGVLADEAVDIVFREPMLRPGATTVFEFFYVWGRTEAEVEMRFDELGSETAPCVGRMDGDPCIAAGEPGTCRLGACCTGCFDGARCVPGASIAKCGAGGAECDSCADDDLCTADSCAAGICANRAIPAGGACDDGLFCTTGDRCNGAGVCLGSGASPCADELSCTTEECVEERDFCRTNALGACVIDEACVPEGTTHPTEACLGCQPVVNPTGWSDLPVGTICGDSSCIDGTLFVRACNDGGACVSRPGVECPTGECEDETRCVGTCLETGCPMGQWCNAATMICEPARPAGEACMLDEHCLSGSCVDGVCCASSCDGTCVRCDIVPGACTPVSSGTDPDGECALACNGAGACEASDGGVRADGSDREIIIDDGCSCSSASPSDVAFLLVAWLVVRRRRRG
jgi:uncharacterized protein (TIGR03382 family)